MRSHPETIVEKATHAGTGCCHRFVLVLTFRYNGIRRLSSGPARGIRSLWEVWQTVTQATDAFLVTLTTKNMQTYLEWKGKPVRESIGTLLQRNIYHYWFHTGEAHAIRQMLVHGELPQFVGDMSRAAYRPE
jgi:hypothetical protein